MRSIPAVSTTLALVLLAACSPVPGARITETPSGDLLVEVSEAQSFNALAVYVYGEADLGRAIARAAELDYHRGVPAGVSLRLPPKLEMQRLAEKERRADSLVRDGEKALSEGEFQKAAQRFAEALEARPGASEILVSLGLAELRAGRLEEAAAALERALALRPDDVETHYTLGVLHQKSGDYRRALDQFEAALEALGEGKSHPRAQFEYARTLQELGRFKEAHKAYELFIFENPGDPWVPMARSRMRDLEEVTEL